MACFGAGVLVFASRSRISGMNQNDDEDDNFGDIAPEDEQRW